MQGPDARPAARGVTLVELMFVVALVGILATLTFSYRSKSAREQSFDGVVGALQTALTRARAEALRSGTRASMSIEQGDISAFVDKDGDRMPSAADTMLYRLSQTQTPALPSGIRITAPTLREFGSGPATATFDPRGFFVDAYDGSARHDVNFCVTDAQTGRSSNLQLTRLGGMSLRAGPCDAQPSCPLVAY